MAIKMDGHTITSLQLKASDGSEVTKQLTEEGTIPTPTGSLSIIANGTYDVTDKASAVVAVPAPEINLQNKTATANGEVTADEGYDGLGVVTVAVSGDTPTYQEKTATQNGVVLPDEGYDALSKVTVNVPAPVLPTLTNPASASDILSGKEALDGNGAKLTGTCTFDADTSDANAIASDIAQGKTAYVNGVKVTGTASGGDSPVYNFDITPTEDTQYITFAGTLPTNYLIAAYSPAVHAELGTASGKIRMYSAELTSEGTMRKVIQSRPYYANVITANGAADYYSDGAGLYAQQDGSNIKFGVTNDVLCFLAGKTYHVCIIGFD